MAQSTVSIMYRNSAQKIAQSDVKQLLAGIVADARAALATVLEHAERTPELWLPRRIAALKPYWTPCSSCQAGYRNKLLAVSPRLRTSPLPTPRRTSALSVLGEVSLNPPPRRQRRMRR